MNNQLNLTIAGKPKAKKRPRMNTRTGAIWNPSREDMEYIRKEAQKQLPEEFKMIEKGIPVIVDVFFFFKPTKGESNKKFIDLIKNDDYPYLKKGDRDNLDKNILDSFSKVIFYDDNQVYGGTIYKYYSMYERTEVTIRW